MNANKPEIITLAGGCFWCLEAVFARLRGVHEVESGYSNGQLPNPNYEQVCSGASGHAEVVRVHFDPGQIALRQLLEVFFVIHDPTTLNRQGADHGSQYRSGIYTHDAAQDRIAAEMLEEAQRVYGGKVVTELQREHGYTSAEAYHQRYFERNPQAGYCAFVIEPKVEKFRQSFRSLLRDGA